MFFNLLWFLFGELLHVGMQLDEIARFFKNQPDSRVEIFIQRIVPYIVRIAIASSIFVLWLQGTLADVLMAAGVTLPDTAEKILALHVTGAIAVLAGYVADSLLGYIPMLKTTVPDAGK